MLDRKVEEGIDAEVILPELGDNHRASAWMNKAFKRRVRGVPVVLGPDPGTSNNLRNESHDGYDNTWVHLHLKYQGDTIQAQHTAIPSSLFIEEGDGWSDDLVMGNSM